ncbi:DUF167 family protein [Devosia sp. YIM 151766]|uniref:DUF167 family protein n=1 Tax=Devosia sp. YIM 151766 TaxID=3017325 RepID=UPI00255CC4D0|nr:DUF167 family protein [Devosia sp. YIM 151766]WIY52779.1 DUF167 family protein [Devosia sp. YIM 151766]
MPGDASLPAWCRASETGLLLYLRVTPNAGRDAIMGAERRDDGNWVLRVRVSAVPDKGKANAAVIALLAKALDVPRSTISLVSGETGRMKVLAVLGEATALAERAHFLAAPHAGQLRKSRDNSSQ